jgi:hypothetical protein
MPRYIVQSKSTGRLLVPSSDDGQPEWTLDLKKAGVGVVPEIDRAVQLVEDWCDVDDLPQIIDLDRLGTQDDYE